jgi:hypothetical protein
VSLKIEESEVTLTMAVSLYDKGGRLNQVAAGAYAGYLEEGGKDPIEIWGYGGEKNSQVMNAYGLSHAIEEIVASREGDDPFRLRVFVRKSGFVSYFKEYTPRWFAEDSGSASLRKHDAAEAWKRAAMMLVEGKITINEQNPPSASLTRIQKQARRIANTAHKIGVHHHTGIANSGVGFETAK